MKTVLFLCCLLTATGVVAQRIPDQLVTTETPGYTTIPNVHVSLLAPKGYQPATDFDGVAKTASKTSPKIEVKFDDTETFASHSERFNEAYFKKAGMKVSEYREFTLNGYSARFAVFTVGNLVRFNSLLFGNDSFCVFVMGSCSPDDAEASKEIRAAVLSTFYRGN